MDEGTGIPAEGADSGTMLTQLLGHFLMVSLMAVGGGVVTVVPEIHRYVVETQHWLTNEQFTAAWTLAQAAPGPNALFATLVGFLVAGWIGAIITTFAIIVPPATLTLLVSRLSGKGSGSRIGRALRSGLAPIAIGMLLATGMLLVRGSVMDWRGGVAAVLAVVIMMNSRVNPVWLILVGAVAGIAGLV